MNQPQQNYADALYAERKAREQADYDSLVNAIAASQSDAELAQRDLADAHARTDSAGMADAQRRLARAEARLVTLESGKESMDERDAPQHSGSYPNPSAVQQYQQRQYQPQYSPMDLINSMTNLTAKERQWLIEHQDLLTRPTTMTRLQAAYFEAQDRQIPRDSDEYFNLFDHRFNVHSPAAGNGKPEMPKVTLTEAEAAKISGVSPEVYAENKRKLQQLKAMGLYGDR
jgi:hypothetical protein